MLHIVIPTYNRVHFLRKILSTIDLKNNKRVDVTIVDNQCTDNTRDVVVKHGFKYIQHKKFISAVENIGFCYTLYEDGFTWVVGDDEIFFDHSIELALHAIECNPTLVLQHDKLKTYDTTYDFIRQNSRWDIAKPYLWDHPILQCSLISKIICKSHVFSKTTFDFYKCGPNWNRYAWFYALLKGSLNSGPCITVPNLIQIRDTRNSGVDINELQGQFEDHVRFMSFVYEELIPRQPDFPCSAICL